jgi:hypothetical protein
MVTRPATLPPQAGVNAGTSGGSATATRSFSFGEQDATRLLVDLSGLLHAVAHGGLKAAF